MYAHLLLQMYEHWTVVATDFLESDARAYAGNMGVSKRGHQSKALLKELIKGWFAQHGESAVFVPSGPAGDGAPP